VDLLGPNRAGLFINLIPVFTALLSVWLLDESIRTFHLGGMGLIAGGMFLFYIRR
jgi:drug/metabolite transporter (DMT)-like permease